MIQNLRKTVEHYKQRLESFQSTTDTNTQYFKVLKGLPFYCKWPSTYLISDIKNNGRYCCFNHAAGMPHKNGIEHELYDYEYELFEYLERDVPTDPKNRHIYCLKSTGLGISEFFLRYIAWRCTRDDVHKDHKMAIIVGPRLELATTLIERLKKLFLEKGLVPSFDTKSTTVIINGCEISCYPSHHMDDLRGMTNLDLILADEADFLIESQQANLLDVMERYIPKTNPILALISTPNKPSGLFSRIMAESDDTCIYRKFLFDYTRGLGKIYSEQEISLAKQSHNFEREFNLHFTGIIGNVLHQRSIDVAVEKGKLYDPDFSDPYHFHIRSLGLDPAWGSSNFGIVVTQYSEGTIQILLAEEYSKPDYNEILRIVYDIISRYRIDLTYIDGANPSFIRSLKLEIGEKADYLEELKRAESEGLKPSDVMKIIPVNFSTEHKAMLGFCKLVFEKDGGCIAIHPKFDKLITSLRTAVENNGTLDKESTSFSDIFDAWRLALKFYKFEGK
jgi:hypothetical protein